MPATFAKPLLATLICLACELASAGSLDQWTIRASGTGNNLYDVVYGQGKFVAVGQNHSIFISTNNGASWSYISNTLSNSLNSIACGDDLFVTVGDNGTIGTSLDGASWTQQTSGTSNHLRAVRFLNGTFMTVGSGGTILVSTNGTSWAARNSGTTFTLDGVAYGNGMFCAVGGTNSNPNVTIRSVDGLTWFSESSNNLSLYDIVFGNGVFVVPNIRGRIQTSANAIDWINQQIGNTDYLIGCTFAQGRFIAVGGPFGGGGQKIVSSADGANWTVHPVTTLLSGRLEGVAYGNGYFVAVGQKGIILQSDPVFDLESGERLSLGGIRWTLTGEIGRNYNVQFATNLTETNWTTLTNFISTTETTFVTDPFPAATVRFYRVLSP
jgi:hypothetical protein